MACSTETETKLVTFVEVEVTTGCHPSRRRYHCRGGPVRGGDTLTIGQWQRVIADAAAAGVEIVQFVGSESALFPDLVQFALSAGVKVDVHSDLVHVHEELWELLARPDVSLGVCWYTADPLQHAEITGTEGSWYLSRQNTVKALERGLLPRAEIVTIADGQAISAARAELHRLGVDVIAVDHARSTFMVTAGRPPTWGDLCGGCGDGRAGVTGNGAVVPCLVLGRGLVGGNVNDSSLAEILTDRRWTDNVASIPRAQAYGMCAGPELVACARVGRP